MNWTRLAAVLACVIPLGAAAAQGGSNSSGADPLGTRGTLMMSGRYDLWSFEVPLPSHPQGVVRGSAVAGFLSTDLYGRILGFDMSYRVASTNALFVNDRALSERSSYTLIEVQPDFNYVLVNSTPFFLSVGLGANVRVNVLNQDEPPATRALTAWTTVAGGPDARVRFFLSENFYATGSVFVGFFKIAGSWNAAAVTATAPTDAGLRSGDLDGIFVLNAMGSFAWRPVEWFAVSAGIGYRKGSFSVKERDTATNQVRDRGTANEDDIQPFAGIEFLY